MVNPGRVTLRAQPLQAGLQLLPAMLQIEMIRFFYILILVQIIKF